jgi:hypothetical protein
MTKKSENICPANTDNIVANLTVCEKIKSLLNLETLKKTTSSNSTIMGYKDIQDYNKKSRLNCYKIEKNNIMSIFQDESTIFYTLLETIISFHEYLLNTEVTWITPNIYTNEYQPCVCSISINDTKLHLINPKIISSSQSTNEITELIPFINKEEWIVKQEIPKNILITYKIKHIFYVVIYFKNLW